VSHLLSFRKRRDSGQAKGSIPVGASNVRFGQIWDEKGQKRPLILLETVSDRNCRPFKIIQLLSIGEISTRIEMMHYSFTCQDLPIN
jgi:hypothetical protein